VVDLTYPYRLSISKEPIFYKNVLKYQNLKDEKVKIFSKEFQRLFAMTKKNLISPKLLLSFFFSLEDFSLFGQV